MKKTILTLGTVAAALAPLAAVISCGGSSSSSSTPEADKVTMDSVRKQTEQELAFAKTNGSTVDGTSLTLKVRALDEPMWQAVATKFNAHHKGTIQISNSTFASPSLIGDFSTAAGSNSLADLNVADMNSISYAKQNGVWFDGFDLEGVSKEENKTTYDVFDGQTSFGKDKLMSSHITINSNKNGVAFAYPLGYATKGLGLNSTMITDTNATIHSYAPLDAVVAGQNDSTGIGLDDLGTDFPRITAEQIADGDTSEQKVAKNIAYMSRYIKDAGNAHSILNTDAIKAAHPNWLGFGPGNMYQRIYSAAQSMMSAGAHAGGVYAMAFKELISSFDLIATAPIDGLYDFENRVLKKQAFNTLGIQNKAMNPKLAKYLWQAYGGYMFNPQGGYTAFMTSDGINKKQGDESGEAEPFMNKRNMFQFNAPWALNMGDRGWSANPRTNSDLNDNPSYVKAGVTYENNKGYSSGQIHILGAPYGAIAGADSLVMAKGLSTAKRIVAKRFFKYINNAANSEKVSFNIDKDFTFSNVTIGEAISWNFVSSNKDVQQAQKTAKAGEQGGWFEIGQKADGTSSDKYPNDTAGVAGTVWKNTDQDFFTIYETKAFKLLQEHYNTKPESVAKWSFNQFQGKFNQIASQYYSNIALAD